VSLFSFHFLVFLCALFLAFHGSRSKRWRRVLLSLANLVFLLALFQDSRSWMALGVFVAVSYGMLRLMRAWRWRGWPVVFVTLTLGALVYLKRYEFLRLLLPDGLLAHALEIVGISYMSFKLIHMIVDLHQGQLPPFDFASYANYQLGFFSVLAGPIQRYKDFHVYWDGIDARSGTDEQALRHWSRVVSGLIQLGLLASVALHVYGWATERFGDSAGPASAIGHFLLLFYAYPAYVYFNFSGYCNAVIGAAGLLGMRHQENFDRPYLARNLLDFWNRWHISLTLWIRDYVFMASYKWVAERWAAQAARLGYLLAFVALFLAGVWHGSTWNFAIFGLIHGVGVAATQIYGDALRAVLGRAGVRTYIANPWIRRVSVAGTFHYVCFSFLFFPPGVAHTLDLLKSLYSKVA